MSIEIEPAHLDLQRVRKKAFEMYSDAMVFDLTPEDLLQKLMSQRRAYLADPFGVRSDYESKVGGDSKLYFAAVVYLLEHFAAIQAAYDSYAVLRRAGTALNIGAVLESIDLEDC